MLEDQNSAPQASDGIGQPASPKAPINKNQKYAAAGLVFFGLLIIFLWIWQLKASINEPFARRGTESPAASQLVGQNTVFGDSTEEELRQKDTDQDGLSDWDELYFYKTSPYLSDSDSDGYSDQQEIDSGNDPLCPVGQACAQVGLDNQQAAGQSALGSEQALLDLFNYQQFLSNTPVISEDAGQNDLKLLDENLDAPTLRSLLLEKGMKKEILDQISDQDLLDSFQEVIQE